MSISLLGAMRLAHYEAWKAILREALTEGGSVTKAIKVLRAKGHSCSRAMVFNWLREHPDVLEGIELPPPKGLPRGASRQDTRPGWSPSPKNIARRAKRNGASTKVAP